MPAYAHTARHYFYHLRFELYPVPSPGEAGAATIWASSSKASAGQYTKTATSGSKSKNKGKEKSGVRPSSAQTPLRVPARGENIFGAFLAQQPVDVGVRGLSSVENGAVKDYHASNEYETIRSTASTNHAQERHSTAAHLDWRFSLVNIKSLDMDNNKAVNHSRPGGLIPEAPRIDALRSSSHSPSNLTPPSKGYGTKARFEPSSSSDLVDGFRSTDVGWGVVHLYRDAEESPELMRLPEATTKTADATLGVPQKDDNTHPADGLVEEDTTILCIPAVPSYMTPSDFLGWVGAKTREEVSHFRMVMTGRMNRYLVLMKFRDSQVARKWRQAWDGKVFSGMEPETCNVMFIRSVVFDTPEIENDDSGASFPDMSHDPFTPRLSRQMGATVAPGLPLKPLPPPTPALIELPTCPVCLERMDDTTGLLTILCQHVFHCDCLQKWRGSGCPVCRHTQPSAYLNLDTPFGATPHGARSNDLCVVCDCPDDLWICLICGNVGCGRYKGGHAKEHWKETAHCYSLEIETQHVWDYASDLWVHRLIQTKGDGKLVELPSNSRSNQEDSEIQQNQHDNESGIDMVPRAKLDGIGMEYTHLLTSQLDSQRTYFEELVKQAVDKATSASKSAEASARRVDEAEAKLHKLETAHSELINEIIPSLEKERDRVTVKAEKSSEIARSMTNKYQEEKQVASGLMKRIEHVNEAMMKMSKEMTELRQENEGLKETNRDLGFFISSRDQIENSEMKEEIVDGTVSLPERKENKPKGKGKGRGK